MLISKSTQGVFVQTFDSENKKLISQKFLPTQDKGSFFNGETNLPLPVDMLNEIGDIEFPIPDSF